MAMNETIKEHVPSVENCADITTKVFLGGKKRDHLISKVLYDIAD